MSPSAEVIVAAIVGMVAHELAHALAAVAEGDPTPLEFGRVSLAPWHHLDVVGTLIVPALTFVTFGALLGWCRPVPVTRELMEDAKHSWLRVCMAGPTANFLVAVVLAMAGLEYGAAANIMIGLFNLLPLPGFDGGKIVQAAFLERSA